MSKCINCRVTQTTKWYKNKTQCVTCYGRERAAIPEVREYRNNKNRAGGRIRTAQWRAKQSKEKLATLTRKHHLSRYYKLTIDQYEQLMIKQNGVCAICKNPESDRRLAVDHCHQSGKIRGLLCKSCNRALGLFQDSTDRIYKAINYLQKSQ